MYCSHRDLQQRQQQRCHHQLGSMPNCDDNGNDKVSFAFAAAQCERALIEQLYTKLQTIIPSLNQSDSRFKFLSVTELVTFLRSLVLISGVTYHISACKYCATEILARTGLLYSYPCPFLAKGRFRFHCWTFLDSFPFNSAHGRCCLCSSHNYIFLAWREITASESDLNWPKRTCNLYLFYLSITRHVPIHHPCHKIMVIMEAATYKVNYKNEIVCIQILGFKYG